MPAAFTPAFAARLNSLCKIQVKEAQQGDRLQAGVAYLAPGGQQMMIDGRGASRTLRVFEDNREPRLNNAVAACNQATVKSLRRI